MNAEKKGRVDHLRVINEVFDIISFAVMRVVNIDFRYLSSYFVACVKRPTNVVGGLMSRLEELLMIYVYKGACVPNDAAYK